MSLDELCRDTLALRSLGHLSFQTNTYNLIKKEVSDFARIKLTYEDPIDELYTRQKDNYLYELQKTGERYSSLFSKELHKRKEKLTEDSTMEEIQDSYSGAKKVFSLYTLSGLSVSSIEETYSSLEEFYEQKEHEMYQNDLAKQRQKGRRKKRFNNFLKRTSKGLYIFAFASVILYSASKIDLPKRTKAGVVQTQHPDLIIPLPEMTFETAPCHYDRPLQAQLSKQTSFSYSPPRKSCRLPTFSIDVQKIKNTVWSWFEKKEETVVQEQKPDPTITKKPFSKPEPIELLDQKVTPQLEFTTPRLPTIQQPPEIKKELSKKELKKLRKKNI